MVSPDFRRQLEGFRSDDRKHPVPAARPSRNPADVHLAAARPASPFPRADEIPRFLGAGTGRSALFRHGRAHPADQAGGVSRRRRGVPAALKALRASDAVTRHRVRCRQSGRGSDIRSAFLGERRTQTGNAPPETPHASRNLRTCITSGLSSVWLARCSVVSLPFSLTPMRLLVRVSISAAEPVQHRLDVLHFEVGVDRMGEDRMQDFSLMMVHEPASFGVRAANGTYWNGPTRLSLTAVNSAWRPGFCR